MSRWTTIVIAGLGWGWASPNKSCDMDSSTSPEMWKKFCCFIIGDNKTFSVGIDLTAPVDDLKKEIKSQNPVVLKDVDSPHLRIYRAEVNDSDDEQEERCIAELQRLSKIWAMTSTR